MPRVLIYKNHINVTTSFDHKSSSDYYYINILPPTYLDLAFSLCVCCKGYYTDVLLLLNIL